MNFKEGHILIVDDNRLNRLKISRGVQQQGYAVTAVDSGPNALKELHDKVIDLVLLDLNMPGMDGYQALSEIQLDEAINHIPVIMLAPPNEMHRINACLMLGAVDYIPPVFDANLLKSRIDAYLKPKPTDTPIGRILVVDDDRTSRFSLSRHLEKDSHDIYEAETGEEALEKLETMIVDLILLDVMMPGIDGFEVCRRLKAKEATKEIPVIFMTALTNTEDKLTGFEVGAVDYITKPIHPEEALARVRTHLRIRGLTRSLERSYETEQKRRRLSDTLREVAKIVSITLRQDQVLDLILSQLERVVSYNRATISLLNYNKLTVVAGRDRDGSVTEKVTIPAHQFPLNQVALEQKQPILVADTSRDERWIVGTTSNSARSFINAPLMVQDRPIGLLGVNRTDPTPYTNDDAQTVFAFALQVAIALENARLAERTQQALRETDGLFKGVQAILGSTDLAQICRNLIEQLQSLVDADGTSIHLVDQDYREVTLSMDVGLLTEAAQDIDYETLMEGIAGQVIRSGEAVLSMSAEDGIEPEATKGRRKQYNIGALIVLPLVSRNRVIGVATVANNLGHRLFTTHDVDLLTALTTQAATAIENVRLYHSAQQELQERRRAEEALQIANTELQRSNADKDKFFSIVAHDLRGPFMPLVGNAQLLYQMIDQLGEAEIRTMSEAMYLSTNRVLNLLDNLLQWARLQMGRMKYQPEMLDLAKIVADNMQLLTENADSKEITLINKIAEEQLVFGDKFMVDTVLRNLISNALKFTGTGGSITVWSVENSDMLEISVEDTGVGISEEAISKLFRLDEFYSTRGTADESGTGLGLLMCKEMVEKNGGMIWVDSILGDGTTFTFTLPLTEKAVA